MISRCCAVWKLQKFTLTAESADCEKIENLLFSRIFRQIISLVKMLLSRYFCQKSVRLNINQFHRNSFNKTFFRENNYCFSKNVTFTKFLSNLYERVFLVFPHLCSELKKPQSYTLRLWKKHYNKSKSVDLTKYSYE